MRRKGIRKFGKSFLYVFGQHDDRHPARRGPDGSGFRYAQIDKSTPWPMDLPIHREQCQASSGLLEVILSKT